MEIIRAIPCSYDYHTHEAVPTGEPVDAEMLGTINVEGYETVTQVETGHVIWYAPRSTMGDEGQHYLARVKQAKASR